MKTFLRIAILAVLAAVYTSTHAQTVKASYKTDLHIVSTNDMHAAFEKLPQMAAIVDSLRCLDKDLLVLCAGDSRTGHPINDLYPNTSYPMISLMNLIGFDCTTLGNHEFDSHQDGLARNINESNFPYICANISADAELGIQTTPYKFFDVKGVRVCVLGVVQIGSHGRPDTHPKNVVGFTFAPVEETIQKYLYLRDECDVFILLSHIGFEDDVKVAEKFPQFDLIVGGHSHTQLEGGEIHNGVLITQNVNKLKRLTYTTLTVENGKVTNKQAKNIEIENYPKKNVAAQSLVNFFSDNPELGKVLAQAVTPFSSYEELGCLMCDAIRDISGSDISFCNAGGVRYEEHPAGDFTVSDVLRLDPFGNNAVVMNITGKELKDMLIACFNADENRFPYTSGVTCHVTYTDSKRSAIKSLKVLGPDGKEINPKKTYKVVGNSYATTVSNSPRKDQGEDTNIATSDMLMSYLKKVQKIDYQGKTCLKEIF